MLSVDNLKKLVFCLCILAIAIILCFSVFSDNIILSKDLIYKNDLVLDVSINNQLCAYDTETDRYYYSSSGFKNNDVVKINSLYDVKYKIKENTSDYIHIYVYSDEYYEELFVDIVSMPIINLKSNDLSSFGLLENFSVDIDLSDNDSVDDSEDVYSKYIAGFSSSTDRTRYYQVSSKVRGSSSTVFPKKSYKIEFDKKVKLYNLPKDDKYVLDALYIDKSSVRNLLSSEMWNLINDNQKINNDLFGNFVEIFIDNEYQGLYVIKDKVDKKTVELSDSGVLLKAVSHLYSSDIDNLLNDKYKVENDIFLNYEIKRYNYNTFNKLIKNLKSYYSDYSYDSISQSFYIDNFINYKIFVALIRGNDNLTYNQYLSMKDADSKILITPWDMDLTWGLCWSFSSDLYSEFLSDTSSDATWMNNNIIKNMDDKTLSLLKKRYWELRKEVITMENINKYLDSYKTLLISSGSAQRNNDKWYKTDTGLEIERVRDWAEKRLAFLDEYFSKL